MLVPTPKGPVLAQPLHPQQQDNPYAQFGRYGLYRRLMQAQTPSIRPNDQLAMQLGNRPFSRMSATYA